MICTDEEDDDFEQTYAQVAAELELHQAPNYWDEEDEDEVGHTCMFA